jgi:uncharacterized membrane protein YphA (DoxX/SURF4 family)
MTHDVRTDLSMNLGLLLLLVVGAGSWSLEPPIARPRAKADD